MQIKSFFTSFVDRFSRTHTTTLASSLAYYTALSLAPLLLLFVTISSQLSLDLEKSFLTQVRNTVGPSASQTFELIIQNAKSRPDLATASGIIGVLTLLLSASLIFGQLKEAFNQIFECPIPEQKQETTVQKAWHLVKEKLLQMGLAVCCILVVIATLAVSTAITAFVPSDQEGWRMVNYALSFVFYIGLFSTLFHYMPDPHISWRQALMGGIFTSLLFVVGKELLSVYLSSSAVGSPYGVAGSLIVLLVWIYYSAMILFIGAHASSLLAPKLDQRRSRRPRPTQGEPLLSR